MLEVSASRATAIHGRRTRSSIRRRERSPSIVRHIEWMRRNVGSARAAYRRCSPIAWRSASSALLALTLAACAAGGVSGATPVAFTDVTSVQNTAHTGDARIVVTTDAASASDLVRLVPAATGPAGRALVAAFQGQQRTGGYAIRITAIERQGQHLIVHATFTAPARDAIVIQILTSPAHVVSVAASDVSGVRDAVLLDDSGAERARANVP